MERELQLRFHPPLAGKTCNQCGRRRYRGPVPYLPLTFLSKNSSRSLCTSHNASVHILLRTQRRERPALILPHPLPADYSKARLVYEHRPRATGHVNEEWNPKFMSLSTRSDDGEDEAEDVGATTLVNEKKTKKGLRKTRPFRLFSHFLSLRLALSPPFTGTVIPRRCS